MGASLLYGGAFAEAIEHLDKAVVMLETADSPELALRFNASPLAAARILRALAAFVTLDPERAAAEARRAVAAAERIGDAASQSYVYGWKAIFEAVRRNPAEASADARRVLAITTDKELRMWAPSATLVEEWAHSLPGEGLFSAARVRQARPALMEVGLDLILGPVVAALAVEREARAGREGEGLGLVEEMLAHASSNGIRWHDAELRRLRGEALAFSAEAEPARAEAEFNAAVAIAREQGARAFALRAAASLAKLYQATNRPAEAHAVLAPALEGFSSTPEMPEIAEAQALLATLDSNSLNVRGGLLAGAERIGQYRRSRRRWERQLSVESCGSECDCRTAGRFFDTCPRLCSYFVHRYGFPHEFLAPIQERTRPMQNNRSSTAGGNALPVVDGDRYISG
jgi:predicted ATPase